MKTRSVSSSVCIYDHDDEARQLNVLQFKSGLVGASITLCGPQYLLETHHPLFPIVGLGWAAIQVPLSWKNMSILLLLLVSV